MINEQMNKKLQQVVNYTVSVEFFVPKGIDLDNNEQVEEYWVENNVLYIKLKTGETIDVESKGWIDSYETNERTDDEDDDSDDDTSKQKLKLTLKIALPKDLVE